MLAVTHRPAVNKGGICRNFNGAAATCDCNWGWV
jgi:hypothetical protein